MPLTASRGAAGLAVGAHGRGADAAGSGASNCDMPPSVVRGPNGLRSVEAIPQLGEVAEERMS